MCFDEVFNDIHIWYEEVNDKFKNQLFFEVQKDNEECFVVQINTEGYVAELSVYIPDIAPFRFVSFMILSVQVPVDNNLVFCFYDDEQSTIYEIKKQ